MAKALVLLIRGYQLVPRVGPPRCRFYPSCSSYALDALRLHGLSRGIALTVWRLARCHPFHPGGVEYVPQPAVRGGRAGLTEPEHPARSGQEDEETPPRPRADAGGTERGRSAAGRGEAASRTAAGPELRASVQPAGRS